MDPFKFQPAPGVVKQEALIASSGRFIDCDKVRWVRGRPQKIGGWEQLSTASMLGVARGMLGWSDGTAKQIVAVGTERKLYAVPLVEYEPVNITPYKASSTQDSPFTTTYGVTSVRVYMPAHNATVGSGVHIEGAATFNGVNLNGDYTVVSVINGDIFTITAGNAANASGTGGGTDAIVSLEVDIGLANPTTLYGWGTGRWGEGTWGSARAASSYVVDNRQWFLQSFGRILLANYSGSPLFYWDPTDDSQSRAIAVTGDPCPTVMTGFMVTAERIVIAWGTDRSGTRDLLEVWTSRQGDFSDWDYTGLADDQGSPPTVSRLAYGKKVVAGAVLGNLVNILWTDAAVYTKQYTGSANVYNTVQQGTDCGLLGPMAFAIHHSVAYWVSSNKAFHMFNGAESRMPNSSDIAEWIFDQLRASYEIKCFTNVNPRFGEIWFYFVVDNDTEPSLAAVYNIEGQFWFPCVIERTSAALVAGQSEPIMAATDGYLYKHETGLNADGAEIAWRLESAPFEFRNAGSWAECYRIFMDMQRQVGGITVTITAYDGTQADNTPLGTEELVASPSDNTIYPRFSGRQMALKFEGEGVGCDFRMGVLRVHVEKTGDR